MSAAAEFSRGDRPDRRRLRPHELARQDQVLAEARDASREPGSLMTVAIDAIDGQECLWCDCPDDDPDAGCACPPCDQPARVVYVHYWAGEERRMPVCRTHRSQYLLFMSGAIPATVPTDYHVRRIRDDDPGVAR